jgi:RNA-binding protein 39
MGWANQQSSASGVVEVKSDQFPEDANEKILRVNAIMNQLTGTSLTTMIGQVDPMAQQALLAAGPAGALGIMPSAQLASVADAALDMALGMAPIVIGSATPASVSTFATPAGDAKVVGRSDNPTQNILVHNMFDKDEETEQGWENDIRLDFEEECVQYGKIARVVVMSDDPGGMIYASFDSVDAATKCAKSLAGRWFDKRQLRVEFVDSIPNSS